LEAAKRALENINKSALDELKAFAQPAPVIVDVCAACFFLQPKTTGQPDWSGIKMQVLGNFKLVDELKTYDVEHTKTAGANNAKKKMQKIAKDFKETAPEDLAKLISGKSLAVGALYAWTDATLKCYDINKTVEPKKLKAKQMRAAKEKGEKELAATEALVAELTKTLAEANAAKKEKEDELNELQRISAEMTRKLNAASKLITGLGGE